jgi:hypothetical protein
MANDMWEKAQQALLCRGINTWLEVALWITLFYVIVGVIYAVLHIELISQLRNALAGQLTIFADIAALAVTVAGWPFLFVTSIVCGASGCGLF